MEKKGGKFSKKEMKKNKKELHEIKKRNIFLNRKIKD